MTQQRYHATHHDSQPGGIEPPTSPFRPCTREGFHAEEPSSPLRRKLPGLPSFVEPGPQAGDLSTLRFLEPRKLRRLDVEGPSPLLLTLNGNPVDIVRAGENRFDPAVPLQPGDVLRLEVLEPTDLTGSDRLTGWTSPAHAHPQPGQDR